MGGQGLFDERGLPSCGGESSKHSLKESLELSRVDPKVGSWLSGLPHPGMALVVSPFILLSEGRRGAAILRLVGALVL